MEIHWKKSKNLEIHVPLCTVVNKHKADPQASDGLIHHKNKKVVYLTVGYTKLPSTSFIAIMHDFSKIAVKNSVRFER